MHFHPLSVLSIFTIGPLSALATLFASRWDDVQAKHTWNSVPENWVNLGHPPADTTIDLHIALKPQRENALTDALYEVSSPGHPKYGAHLSREQVSELIAPPHDVLELVSAWLGHHGLLPSTVSTEHGGSWVTLIGVPVSRANKLLSASYRLFQHIGTNETVLRTLSYGLPGALLEHVQTVAPTTHFGFPRTTRQKPLMRPGGEAGALEKAAAGELGAMLSSRDDFYVTPSLLRWLYKTSGYVPVAMDRNMLGVVGYYDDYPSTDDLRLFINEYRTDGISATFIVEQISGGGYDPRNPGPEASLSIQYTEAIAYPTPHVFYSTGGSGYYEDDPFVNLLVFVLGQPSVPQTMAISYSVAEFDVPRDHAIYICNLFAQLGARGTSVVLSSGNDGVGRGDCLSSDHSDDLRVQFLPTFPSTCPYVTSVGGTTRYSPEVAASISGGGFSAYFPRPRYQDNAVPTFLGNLGSKYHGLFNAEGRGVPDIALQALDFDFILNREVWSADGTSCSTPAAAGIISLLNDYMLSNGKPPLGFLNPWLYGSGLEGLNDITSGSNPGCNTDGFSAIVGWDPVTGLGSLDFDKLEETLDNR